MKINNIPFFYEKELINNVYKIKRKKINSYFNLMEMFNEINNKNKIMIRVENYKNNKFVIKEINVPQKFYNIFYTFAYILNNSDIRTIFNKKDKEFFEKLKDPTQKITEQMLLDANLQVLIMIGNDTNNIGLEIVGLEMNFISNGNYINLTKIEDVTQLWKTSLMNIIKAPNFIKK